MLQTIKNDYKNAKKNKDTELKLALSQIVDAAQMKAKNNGNREPNDQDYMDALTAMKKQSTEALVKSSSLPETDERIIRLKNEITIITSYLGEEIPEEELYALIVSIHGDKPWEMKDIGLTMKKLDETHKNKYDKSMASKIIRGFVC